jgi:hypothetical protein
MYRLTGLPARLKVGAYWNAIEVVPELRDADDDTPLYGEYSPTRQELRFQRDYPCIGQAIDTVLHEVMHAVYRAYRIPEHEADEETVVSSMAHGLACVMIDNPDFERWLSAASKKARNQ